MSVSFYEIWSLVFTLAMFLYVAFKHLCPYQKVGYLIKHTVKQ